MRLHGVCSVLGVAIADRDFVEMDRIAVRKFISELSVIHAKHAVLVKDFNFPGTGALKAESR